MTTSTKTITRGFLELYEKIINSKLLIRKIYLTVGNLKNYETEENKQEYEQVDLFTNYIEKENERKEEKEKLKKERNIQKTIIDLKNKFGKNSIIKGMDLEADATTIERNKQVGGHSE